MTERNISGSRTSLSTRLTWSENLNKRVRTGDWTDQAVSTTAKIREALDKNEWEQAAQLIDYWMEEAKVVYVIYQVWGEGWLDYLRGRGVTDPEVAAEEQRLAQLLAFPDGTPFDPVARWSEISEHAGLLANRIRAYEIQLPEALAGLDALRESWRQAHDRGADFQTGILTYIANRFGEEAVGEAYSSVLKPYLEERYKPFDIRVQSYASTLERNLYLIFEAMRGHLCGPDRTGDLGFTEYEDRYEVSFDPCGSGGRMQRGDPVEGTPPRNQAPYHFGVTTEKHDWAWNKENIGYYCAHCCYALEYWPAQEWGHPVRVLEPPVYSAEADARGPQKCRWSVYKSLEAIPSEVYERIGLTKPDADSTEN